MAYQHLPAPIRLDSPPSAGTIWDQVIARERTAAEGLFRSAREEFDVVPFWLRELFAWLYWREGGQHVDELQAWARGTGIPFHDVVLANCGYELGHASKSFSLRNVLGLVRRAIRGCSTGIVNHPQHGPVHVRTLDWPLAGMGQASRVFIHQRNGIEEFRTAGFPGFVGVISGLRPGAYSVTINWAPPKGLADFHWGPAFLLRRTLEQCPTYQAALVQLKSTPLSTSVFYTLCGVEDNEGCVIERTQDDAEVRPLAGQPFLAQTNHHQAPRFERNNAGLRPFVDEDPVAASTHERLIELSGKLRTAMDAPPACLNDYFKTLDGPAVDNDVTVQRMVICPRQNFFAVQWK